MRRRKYDDEDDWDDESPRRAPEPRGNLAGATGFALNLTTLMFLCSGVLASRELTQGYLVGATCCSAPLSLAGLICSIVGCVRPGRPKVLALIGGILGGLLVVLVIPGILIALKNQPR